MAKVLLTGVTSFTGCYIAKSLLEAGHEVTGVLTKSKSSYQDPLILKRLQFSKLSEFLEEAPFGSENFLKHCRENAYDVFVSHGAAIQGYRSPDFDFLKSVNESLKNVRELYSIFSKNSLKGIIHSGTVFESVDGLGPVSPYGLSKQLVWESVQYFAGVSGLSLAKIWIPNPIGPMENEDRLLPIFAKQWKNGIAPNLTAPKIVYDHVPASWLAQTYVKAAQDILSESSKGSEQRQGTSPKAVGHYRPSAFVWDNLQLATALKEALEKRGAKKLDLQVNEDPKIKVSAPRKNTQSCPELLRSEATKEFWDSYAEFWI